MVWGLGLRNGRRVLKAQASVRPKVHTAFCRHTQGPDFFTRLPTFSRPPAAWVGLEGPIRLPTEQLDPKP